MNPSLKYAKFGHLYFPYFYAKNTTKGLHFIGMAHACQGFLKEIGVTILIRIECRSDLYWVYSLADPGAPYWPRTYGFSHLLPLLPPPLVDKVHALPKIKSGIRHWVDHIFNFFTITPSPAVPIEKMYQ